jgi:hypothetical protein
MQPADGTSTIIVRRPFVSDEITRCTSPSSSARRRDGEQQAEAVVVVGVFADQVDPTGTERRTGAAGRPRFAGAGSPSAGAASAWLMGHRVLASVVGWAAAGRLFRSVRREPWPAGRTRAATACTDETLTARISRRRRSSRPSR